MRDRPEFDSTRPDDAELTEAERAEVDARLGAWRGAQSETDEIVHADDVRPRPMRESSAG